MHHHEDSALCRISIIISSSSSSLLAHRSASSPVTACDVVQSSHTKLAVQLTPYSAALNVAFASVEIVLGSAWRSTLVENQWMNELDCRLDANDSLAPNVDVVCFGHSRIIIYSNIHVLHFKKICSAFLFSRSFVFLQFTVRVKKCLY